MRKITNRIFDLRKWQGEAYQEVLKLYNSGKNSALIVATPGAGKTIFALRTIHDFFMRDLIDRVVIVAPSEQLKVQWAINATKHCGLDIDPDFSNAQGRESEDYHGIAVTYALLGMDKAGVHAQNTSWKRTMVVLDEVHHCGNKEHLTWGVAIQKAFSEAVFVLNISGTAFRSDDAPIPFVRYDDNNTSIADYTYSYKRAIEENVCRPVYFDTFDGQMKWKVGGSEFEHTFKDSLTPDQVSKRLKTALDPKGEYVREMFRAADNKLSQIRTTHPDAGGLVFAANQKHAKDLAKVIYEVAGIVPPIVVTDLGDGIDKIQAFKDSRERWLVSVKMVSEGVDIPRLRIGVYLTNVKAELFFRQAVGRFVRVLEHLQVQDAFIFIPQDKDIVKLAETIQEEREHALDDAKKGGASEYVDSLFGEGYMPALSGNFVPLKSRVTNKKTIAVSVQISSGMRTSIDTRKPFEELPVYEQKAQLRATANELAKHYALRICPPGQRPDFKAAHKEWISRGGRSMEIETVEELKRRIEFFKELKRTVR